MKKYIDVKTIKVSNLIAEYMVKLYFNESNGNYGERKFIRIVEIDKLVCEHFREITKDDVYKYIEEINKKDFRTRPSFAFVSDNLIGNPLRLFLNIEKENEDFEIYDFSLASDYYFENLETNEIEIT